MTRTGCSNTRSGSREWIRSTGLGFEFGNGDAMWRDAATTGVYPFDFNDREQQYRTLVAPTAPITVVELPPSVLQVVTVTLPAADFASGIVSREQVEAALPR
jgi:hypothetical protein